MPYLRIDATYVKVSWAGHIISVAIGVTSNGRRKVLSMDTGPSARPPLYHPGLIAPISDDPIIGLWPWPPERSSPGPALSC